MLDILCCMVEASYLNIPMFGGKLGGKIGQHKPPLPGWIEEAEPLRQESFYWHRVWQAEGRPSTGRLHDTMIKRRAQYHHAVRELKKRADLTRANKLFQSALSGDRELLKEMRKIRAGTSDTIDDLPESVVGASGEESIANTFRDVYKELYTSARSKEGMVELKKKLEGMIGSHSLDDVKEVTAAAVKKAACIVKANKGDVSEGSSSDCILNAPDLLFAHIASIFQCWLIHGKVTLSLLSCASPSAKI